MTASSSFLSSLLCGCSALSEMESVLLSVSKDRKAQRKQTVFVDALLQSSLSERQVNADGGHRFYSKTQRTTERPSQFPQKSDWLFVCFRSWRTVWFSLWPGASSLPTVSENHQNSWLIIYGYNQLLISRWFSCWLSSCWCLQILSDNIQFTEIKSSPEKNVKKPESVWHFCQSNFSNTPFIHLPTAKHHIVLTLWF